MAILELQESRYGDASAIEPEDMLIAALKDESYLPPSMRLLFVEVFSPIFFYYPNGLKDRSVWYPRDASGTNSLTCGNG